MARRISDILTDTYYKFSVRQGDMLISTSSPPLHLGTSCGLNFVLESNQLRIVLRRTSQMAVTKGLTYGTRWVVNGASNEASRRTKKEGLPSWLKVPTSTFTFWNLLKHYAKQALSQGLKT